MIDRQWTLAIAAAVGLCLPAWGQTPWGLGDDKPKTAEQLVEVDLVSSRDAIAPGSEFLLVVTFEIDEHWHIYWKNAGESGAATEIEIDAPKGFEVGSILWPRPVVLTGPEGTTYGYEDTAALFIPVTAPDELPSGPLTFEASIDWLVCRQACLMGRAERSITLPPSGAETPESLDEALTAVREGLPTPLEDVEDATIAFDGEELVITGPVGDDGKIIFLPEEHPGVRFGEFKAAVDDGRFRLRIPVELKPGNARGKPLVLGGLIGLGEDAEGPSFSFLHPVD